MQSYRNPQLALPFNFLSPAFSLQASHLALSFFHSRFIAFHFFRVQSLTSFAVEEIVDDWACAGDDPMVIAKPPPKPPVKAKLAANITAAARTRNPDIIFCSPICTKVSVYGEVGNAESRTVP
jgi:hypothetical protein